MIDTVDAVVAINFLIESTRTVSVKCVGGVIVKPYKTTIQQQDFFFHNLPDRTEAETVNSARLFSSTRYSLT